MSRFRITDTPLAGLRVVERVKRADERGFLVRLFCADDLKNAGYDKPVAQINQTLTRQRGTVRGLHFQKPPHAEIKLVSCVRGEVWDVAVDMRAGSPTFLASFGLNLSADNGKALLIPEGFAHGFQTLADDCELIYVHSHAYTAASEGGLRPEDPRLAIAWPQPIVEMSARDREFPILTSDFQGFSS